MCTSILGSTEKIKRLEGAVQVSDPSLSGCFDIPCYNEPISRSAAAKTDEIEGRSLSDYSGDHEEYIA